MGGLPFQSTRAISRMPDCSDDPFVASSLRHIIAALDQIASWGIRHSPNRAELRRNDSASPSTTIQPVKACTFKSQCASQARLTSAIPQTAAQKRTLLMVRVGS